MKDYVEKGNILIIYYYLLQTVAHSSPDSLPNWYP